MRRFGTKTLLLTITLGLIAGWMAWLSLPYTPRAVIRDDFRWRNTMSRDCRLLARSDGKMVTKRDWQGELQVWDTHEGRIVCSIPHSEVHPPASNIDYSWAFTPSGDKLVVFGQGKAKSYHVPSGEPCANGESPEFPRGDAPTSQMVADADGNLFVLVQDLPKQTISIRELWTGREVSLTAGCHGCWQNFPGGMIVTAAATRQFREIPSGRLLAEFPHQDDARGSELIEYFAGTPDGRVQVQVANTARIWIDGKESVHRLPAHERPAISPDGRLLGVYVTRLHAYRDWVVTLLAKTGIRPHDSAFVIYDLATGDEIAYMPHADRMHFSPDGKTLVVMTVNTLELYDLPLRKSWLRIVGVALTCAIVVFLAGRWLRSKLRRKHLDEPRPSGRGPG